MNDPGDVSFSSVGRKGLLVFPGALGDFLFFLPTLKRIADRESDSRLEVAMCSEFSELLFHRVPVISVRSLDSHAIGRLFVSPTEVDREVQEQLRSYDFIYSWLGSNQPDFVKNLEALLSGDLQIFSFRSLNPEVHMTDYYLSCVENSSLPSTFPATFPEIALSSDAQVWCQRFWGCRRPRATCTCSRSHRCSTFR